jgi:excisionase family DNA binding protein
MSTEPDLISPEELALALNITPVAVAVLIRKRRIPYYRLGWRHIRISLSEVLERSRVPAEKPIAPTPRKYPPKVNQKHLPADPGAPAGAKAVGTRTGDN